MNTHDTSPISRDRISNGAHTDIERIVMRRVRLIRILKLVISTAVLAVLTAVATLWGIGKEVWVARIIENAPHNLMDLPRFYFAAFAHTNLIVQALSLLTLASLIYLAFEIARLIIDAARPPRS